MLDQAFDALKTYDWGADPKVLNAIDEALVSTHGEVAARKDLETRLNAALKTAATRDAKDYICRALRVIGTTQSVPVLAELLSNNDLSHMGRYALERIPDEAAAQALRAALPKLSGALRIGVIGSLGSRGDAASVAAIAPYLADSDAATARAAAIALGDIGTADAAKALASAKMANPAATAAAVDASIVCAEKYLAAGNKAEALAIYKSLIGEDKPKHVRLAGTNGVVACAKQK